MFGKNSVVWLRGLSEMVISDRCVRLVAGAADHGYGYGTGYTPDAILDCHFRPRPQADAMGGTEVRMIVADIYFRRGTVVLPDDRLRITHLHDDAVTPPQTFAIVQGPVENHIHIHAELALVTE